MLPLAGYAERLSARPGQTLRFHVANATGVPVQARVVRVEPLRGRVELEPAGARSALGATRPPAGARARRGRAGARPR